MKNFLNSFNLIMAILGMLHRSHEQTDFPIQLRLYMQIGFNAQWF